MFLRVEEYQEFKQVIQNDMLDFLKWYAGRQMLTATDGLVVINSE